MNVAAFAGYTSTHMRITDIGGTSWYFSLIRQNIYIIFFRKNHRTETQQARNVAE